MTNDNGYCGYRIFFVILQRCFFIFYDYAEKNTFVGSGGGAAAMDYARKGGGCGVSDHGAVQGTDIRLYQGERMEIQGGQTLRD